MRRVGTGVAFGLGCLGAGMWIGSCRLLPTKVWTEAPVSSPSAATWPSFADVVEQCRPGVVSVDALVELPDDAVETAALGESRGVRKGAGFVVDQNGLVVTARHLTLGAVRTVVVVPGLGRFDAALVGEDDVTDIAVLRLSTPVAGLRALPLGRSEELRAGDWIVAIGNPLGFTQSVTAGIVSFVGRHLQHDDARVSSDFLQFSAPVNRGNSGGPVVDLQGRVVGVTTEAADAAQGISFAIPSSTLKWVLDAMDESHDGRVHRGHLGLAFDSISGVDELGKPRRGVVVHKVLEGGAAEAAGVQPGDIVLAVDDEPIQDAGELYERITRTPPGRKVSLSVQRHEQRLPPLAAVLRDAASKQDREKGIPH